MAQYAQARLVNGVFDDPAVIIDFRFGARALLLDLGDIGRLSPREVFRTRQVFVSHMHMDHFIGFDRLLRLSLYQPKTVEIVGPPGLVEAVEAKLGAYSWNLLGPQSVPFTIVAADWSGRHRARARFAARTAFRREDLPPPDLQEGLLHAEDDFRVRGAVLDHGIPTLAFAFEEREHVNVDKVRLAALGLPVGPWLATAKTAMRRGDREMVVRVGGREIAVGELAGAGALTTGPGQRIAYASDFGFTPANIAAVLSLARGADRLFIESAFLDRDAGRALATHHLTARQAGEIARLAGVARPTQMHFSTKHLAEEAAMRDEFCRAAAASAEEQG